MAGRLGVVLGSFTAESCVVSQAGEEDDINYTFKLIGHM